MKDDWFDNVLKVGALFDWLSPIVWNVDSFQHEHFHSHDWNTAADVRDALKKRGISSKIKGNAYTGYGVYLRSEFRIRY